MNMNEGGKGDAPRPLSISKEEFDARWDAIFNQAEKDKLVKEKDGGFTINVNVENQDFEAKISYKENI